TDYAPLVDMLTRLNSTGAAAPPAPVTPTIELPRVSPSADPSSAAPPSPPASVAGQEADTPAADAAASAPADAKTLPAKSDERLPFEDRRSGEDRRAPSGDPSLRVGVALLDKLMTLVGELVLARNQILQFTSTQRDSSFIGATQRLNLVTSELQEGVMK